MTYVKVIDDVHTEVTRSSDPNDEWDRDDTEQTHSIRGIQVVGKNDYYDVQVAFEIDPTRPYFLVYGIYSTGDSFGHDEGRIEFVGLYENLEVAHENVRRIEQHDETYRQLNSYWYHSSKQMSRAELKKLEKSFDPYTVQLMLEDGREYSLHVPWHGYFERLTSVEVEPVMVR